MFPPPNKFLPETATAESKMSSHYRWDALRASRNVMSGGASGMNSLRLQIKKRQFIVHLMDIQIPAPVAKKKEQYLGESEV